MALHQGPFDVILIESFEAGVDDFIYKPFSLKALQLRIEAHLKHILKKDEVLQFEDVLLNLKKRTVYIDQKAIHLTKKRI